MDDTSQIQPPPSFAELFRTRSGKLSAPIAEVVARYELCEDLASHLTEQAQTLYHSGNSSEEQVLLGMHAGLAAEGSVVTALEAGWIVQRLAELLEWRAPQFSATEDRAKTRTKPVFSAFRPAFFASKSGARSEGSGRRMQTLPGQGPPGRRSIGSDKIAPDDDPGRVDRVQAQGLDERRLHDEALASIRQ